MDLVPTTLDSFDLQIAALERDVPMSRGNKGRFWRMERPVLDEHRKLIKGGLWDYQRDWWNLQTFVKVLVAGYGAGKSMALCKRAISSSLENHGCMIAMVSPTFTMARRTIIRSMEELLKGKQRLLGNHEFWYKYNRSNHEFTIRYKGRLGTILILSGEEPQHLKGPNLAAAYLDEPFIMDEEVFTQMVGRVRHPDAQLSEIAIAGTPESLNWGYQICKKKSFKADDLEHALSVGVINGSTADNQALDPKYVKRLLARLTPQAAKAYVEGKFVNLTEGRHFYGFDEDINVVDHEMPKGAVLGVGMDFNVDPMTAVVFWRTERECQNSKGQLFQKDHIHYFDEVIMENSDTKSMAEALRERPYGKKLVHVYPDPSGRIRHTNAPSGITDFHFLEEAGFQVHFVYGTYNIRDSLNISNGKLKPSSGPITCTIGPKCEKLIEYLTAYSHKTEKQQKHMKHLLDAFRYPMSNLFPLPTDRAKEIEVQGV